MYFSKISYFSTFYENAGSFMVHFLTPKAVMLFESDKKSGEADQAMTHLLVVATTCRYTIFLQ